MTPKTALLGPPKRHLVRKYEKLNCVETKRYLNGTKRGVFWGCGKNEKAN
jgi:hypothetical protein